MSVNKAIKRKVEYRKTEITYFLPHILFAMDTYIHYAFYAQKQPKKREGEEHGMNKKNKKAALLLLQYCAKQAIIPPYEVQVFDELQKKEHN